MDRQRPGQYKRRASRIRGRLHRRLRSRHLPKTHEIWRFSANLITVRQIKNRSIEAIERSTLEILRYCSVISNNCILAITQPYQYHLLLLNGLHSSINMVIATSIPLENIRSKQSVRSTNSNSWSRLAIREFPTKPRRSYITRSHSRIFFIWYSGRKDPHGLNCLRINGFKLLCPNRISKLVTNSPVIFIKSRKNGI